jgi:hypothetical protein
MEVRGPLQFIITRPRNTWVRDATPYARQIVVDSRQPQDENDPIMNG